MAPPSDWAETLAHKGRRPEGRAPHLVIACGALARELLALRDAGGPDFDLACLPAILHNRPERIAPAIEAAVAEARPDYAHISVAYGDCGTGGGLERLCERLGVAMIAAPHCYAFFSGTQRFLRAAEDEFTAFYVTDFLVRQFDAFVTRPLGLDRHPELRDAYFGSYETLVYLAQTEDDALTARAREAAAGLGLGFERRFTGMGDLADWLETERAAAGPR